MLLHGHRIEGWDLSGLFVQGPLFWPAACIVGFVVAEVQGHALMELSAEKLALADFVPVGLDQILLVHVDLVRQQQRQVSGRLH